MHMYITNITLLVLCIIGSRNNQLNEQYEIHYNMYCFNVTFSVCVLSTKGDFRTLFRTISFITFYVLNNNNLKI